MCTISSCVILALTCGIQAVHGENVRDNQKGRPVSEMMPWYKSGDDIHNALHSLAESCYGADASLNTEFRGNLAMDVFRVRRSSADPKTKAMLVFGEHARELISPESGLAFAQTLCQGSSRADSVLNDVEFILVPNANPIARKQVESGSYCKRTNEDGVDLNRNWGDQHRDESYAGSGDETDPGPRGFSEPESQLLKELVDQNRPDIYLSIHSGAYLLGSPYGYTEHKTPVEEADMEQVLQPISTKYCNGQCPYGGLAKMIQYDNGGCDIDYVYKTLHTPYVFTWEIYTGERFRDSYIEKAADMSAKRKSFLQRDTHKRRLGHGLENPESDENVEDCIDQFLPKSESDVQHVVENWSNAYLELCEEVVKRRKHA
jgi:hypothetical protein